MKPAVKIGLGIGVVVALLVGIGVGFVLGDSSHKDAIKQSQPTVSEKVDSKAAGLRVSLNTLEIQHVGLLSTVMRTAYDNSRQFEPSKDQLDQNSKTLAALIGSVYGGDSRDRFYDIWADHIDSFVDYAKASRAGDKKATTKAADSLDDYVETISKFFNTSTPDLQTDAIAQLMTDQVSLLKQVLDQYRKNNLADSYDVQSSAEEQATTKIADSLARAIVKQKPNMFNL